MGIFLKDINLKGKTAMITGATKGLGRGAAEAIAEAGGDIIAIGAQFNDDNGSNAGHVRVYQYSSGSWSQLGSDIDGASAGDQIGLGQCNKG